MGRIFILVPLTQLLIFQITFSQTPILKAGLNLSTISTSGSAKNNIKPGFYLGVSTFKSISNNNLIKAELVYSQQGAKFNSKETATYSYLNMPILLSVGIGKIVHFDIGPQVGIILSGIVKGDKKEDITAKLRTLDFSLSSGFTFSLSKAIKLESRVNYGLSNTVRAPYPGTSRNFVFQAGLQIHFIKEDK